MSLLSVLLDPFSCSGLPSAPAGLPLLSNRDLLCVLRRWVFHYGQDGLYDELCVESGHPVRVNGLRANLASVRLHTWVVNLRDELDLGWLEWVVVREIQVDCEAASDEGGSLGAVDVYIPDHDIVLGGFDRHTWNRLSCQVAQLLHERIKKVSQIFRSRTSCCK